MHFFSKTRENRKRVFIVIFCVGSMVFNSCKSLELSIISRDIKKEIKNDDFFKNQFTGFCLYDPEGTTFVSEINADHYFNPASNTKILTTLSVLQNLGDSIPSFAFESLGKDTLNLLPLADPTFLHNDFDNTSLLEKLGKYASLKVYTPSTSVTHFGSGWAWDDYSYYFQPERSFQPIYGNVVNITFDSTLIVSPNFFTSYINVLQDEPNKNALYRDEHLNIFNSWLDKDSSAFSRTIPFKTSSELYKVLLADTISGVYFDDYDDSSLTDTIYSQRTIDVLALMMKRSDNFLAEQLLIQSGIVNGLWDVDTYRNHLIKNWSTFLTSTPQWYDGSGLSRYNLITPKSLVEILTQIYDQLSLDEIKYIFPVGGESGTIKNYYKNTTPYVIAKTGTLKNNHCLSGYLITKSGKTLIFSFMNNHYIGSSDQAKMAMEKLLIKIRDSY